MCGNEEENIFVRDCLEEKPDTYRCEIITTDNEEASIICDAIEHF